MARIVIVDDSKISRMLLRDILTSAGHEVVAEADNGQAGYEECKAHLPDIVTLDVGMPTVDGLTALKMIRADYPELKAVMISAASEKGKVFEALDRGASYYILKPFDATFVTAAIDSVLVDPSPPGSGFSRNRAKQLAAREDVPNVSSFSVLADGMNFTITITSHFVASHLSALQGAVRAIKASPLHLKLHVEEPDTFDPDALMGLLELMRNVRERGGRIEMFDGKGQLLNMSKEEQQDLAKELTRKA